MRLSKVPTRMALVLAVLATACGGPKAPAPPKIRPVFTELKMEDFRFDPHEISIDFEKEGPPQFLNLLNNGSVAHNFSIPELGIDFDRAAKDPPLGLQAYNFKKSGTFTFFCKFHRDQGMEGKIEVRGGKTLGVGD